jgi:hypothetical protein
MPMRTALLVAIGLSAAQAAAGPTCDALDNGPKVELRDTDIDLDGRDLVLRASGAELVHVAADGKLFVEGRPVTVPPSARPHLVAYVDGFHRLGADAADLGRAGAKLGVHALTGLVEVLFTESTLDDHEREMVRAGERLEGRAEQLCQVVAELQRTERELQQRIPAFPAFLAPVQTAL